MSDSNIKIHPKFLKMSNIKIKFQMVTDLKTFKKSSSSNENYVDGFSEVFFDILQIDFDVNKIIKGCMQIT